MMNIADTHVNMIQGRIEPLRSKLLNHPVYLKMNDIPDLRLFMEYHVFAVWDFMSLLKTLQNGLTCTSVPWVPIGSPDTRYLINEIVVGEESDLDANGIRISHFELYLQAMQQAGADVSCIQSVLNDLKKGIDLPSILSDLNVPEEIQEFVLFTFDVIASGKIHLIAGVFTFGREDLIPGMFVSIVDKMHWSSQADLSIFKYYIDRHIEIDGSHHSHLALQMVAELCGTDVAKWAEVHDYAVKALQKRILLWDAIHAKISE